VLLLLLPAAAVHLVRQRYRRLAVLVVVPRLGGRRLD
jgi:hypothetical protein